MRKLPIPTLITAAALILLLAVYAVSFQVRFNEVAVRVRLGRASADSVVKEPGFYWKLPPPLETVERYDVRLRTLDTPETEMKTRDGNNLIVGAFAFWKIEDPLRFYSTVGTPARAEEAIRPRVNAARSIVLGKHAMSELFSRDSQAVQRSHEQIQQEMLAEAAPGILQDYGVKLVEVRVRRISLPPEASQTVLQSMIQERETLAQQYRSEGESIAAGIRARAENAAKQIQAFARRRATEIEAAGYQASLLLLKQIQQEDAEFYVWLLSLDALRTMLEQRTTIFLDATQDVFRNFLQPPPQPGAAAAGGAAGAE